MSGPLGKGIILHWDAPLLEKRVLKRMLLTYEDMVANVSVMFHVSYLWLSKVFFEYFTYVYIYIYIYIYTFLATTIPGQMLVNSCQNRVPHGGSRPLFLHCFSFIICCSIFNISNPFWATFGSNAGSVLPYFCHGPISISYDVGNARPASGSKVSVSLNTTCSVLLLVGGISAVCTG